MLEYSMDDATSDPSSNNPTPFHVGSFVHVAGPSSHYSRRGLEKCFDFTTGLAHCFRNQVEPKMWHALLHDEQNCIVQEGNPHLPMSLNLAFVTAILAILKITLNAILAEHPSQLPQSTSAVESVLDRIKPHVDKHLKSIDTPASPVHILYDIPLLERSIHDGKERTVQGLLTLEFYRAPGRKTAPWHRKCVLKSMNVPWYKGVKLQHKYEFSDETYSPPLVTADELNNVIQVPTLESVSASNDFEFVATSTDLDVVMDQDIDVSASSTQSASHLARLVDDVLMKDGSNPWVVTGTSSFPPVPSRCNSLELDSDIWAPLAGPYVGTLESMLPSKPLSNPGLNEALPSPPIVARLSAVYTSPEQNVYSDPIHHPTDEHRRCNSPENIDLDGNEDGQDISASETTSDAGTEKSTLS
ncbi:hypothetical protein EC991_005436 [Linnemannia zychae]|nr:hypothetical protein EC991_005436 [Linnemannia zychae]